MSHAVDHIPLAGKVIGEVVALSAIAGTFLEWLPTVAAGVAILWHILLIYDWVRRKVEGNNNNKD